MALLIDEFELVTEIDNALNLVIAGTPINNKLKHIYNNQTSTPKFDKRIIYHLDFIPREKIPVYFMAYNIVILPYKAIDRLEIIHLAYSFSKPIIATDVGDFSEIIEHNKSGMILERNTPAALAEFILESCTTDDLKKMGSMLNV